MSGGGRSGSGSKYSTYQRYTASSEVSYNSHSAKSSYRKESASDFTSARGLASTTREIISGTETRSLPCFVCVRDVAASETEGLTLDEGQIVEVLDSKNPASWLVRTKARPPESGWVPGSFFETPSDYYANKRRTRQLNSPPDAMEPKEEALAKRE